MSDETKDVKSAECCQGGGCQVEASGKAKQATTLKESVAAALAESGPQVFDMVKDHLVAEELKTRTELILKGLAKRDQLNTDIRKVKPDAATGGYDADGKVVRAPEFTHAQTQELKKLREQLGGVEKGLEDALKLEKPCFKKLREVAGK